LLWPLQPRQQALCIATSFAPRTHLSFSQSQHTPSYNTHTKHASESPPPAHTPTCADTLTCTATLSCADTPKLLRHPNLMHRHSNLRRAPLSFVANPLPALPFCPLPQHTTGTAIARHATHMCKRLSLSWHPWHHTRPSRRICRVCSLASHTRHTRVTRGSRDVAIAEGRPPLVEFTRTAHLAHRCVSSSRSCSCSLNTLPGLGSCPI
jgi:hypothetical protein